MSFSNLCDSAILARLRLTQRQTVLRDAALQSLQEMHDDPMWACGTQLGAYGAGLKQVLVMNGTHDIMREKSSVLLGFDCKHAENTWDGSMQHFEPLRSEGGSVCKGPRYRNFEVWDL